MWNRHRFAYAALMIIYSVLAIILAHEGAFPHATCVMMAALVYLMLCLLGEAAKQSENL